MLEILPTSIVPSYFTAAFGIGSPASSCSSLDIPSWAIVRKVPIPATLEAPPVAFHICVAASTNHRDPGLEGGLLTPSRLPADVTVGGYIDCGLWLTGLPMPQARA